ncbi:Long-chain-fatty-acid--CoA ligase [Roseivivax sp. THAF40]|uniref:acyl--CoA ligase n=1 Tax=unclassified Roseivivax TaxID=2639302 RepID=UPI0012684077|nr:MULTISPECIES: acyl--CoA ligase [unclassified Roseivivax]QFS82593.1 Long-chain-fatty-acid--CoA ligase [Roseivivax sp. THAF197b]QFT46362.1 Long-chain-fatty-acid--CoA ligase [Roseivivax sp. THAF40]
MQTLAELIGRQNDDAPALGAPGREWLNYGGLKALAGDVRGVLRGAGVAASDRVAIVLPNGPEMAAAFVTVAQSATTAPLNPAYKEDEFAFYLEDLKAKAIIVEAGYDGPARAAADRFGLTVIELTATEPAGSFTLSTDANGDAADSDPTKDDVALILHTSGTTSRPKIVPLLQSNIAASAQNIATSLALTSDDCCLNVMPLFHIHGLVAAVSASLAVGASISCAPGFDALKFFSWLEEVNPTWYTAVPTMHQAILARAPRNREIIEASRLRFLRSSSSSLPGPVMTQLAETFGAPVVEAYGMTEAAHQMCCNPIEPGRQKPGAVGLPAGPEVRIAHEIENRLIDGVGEISISGPNVTPGYEGNPEANEKNFFEAEGKRWFRTGDQGAFDEDGYLALTGRLKEIINRGGEKISPLEVDGTLSDHPAVAQCVTFAIPHPKLGEEVGAAVVLKEGQTATDRDIRDFASERLAAFKVPRKILILDEIPKGATGKLQRIGLAEKLGLVEKA